MRRTLFGKSPELELAIPPRASAREVLLFDLRDHHSTADQNLAERRVSGWVFAPWLLLAGHIVIATMLALEGRVSQNPGALASVLGPFLLSIASDITAGAVMLAWRRFQLAPHTVSRMMCGYVGLTGVLWMVASVATGGLQLADPGFVTVAMITGFFVRSIVSIAS